MLAAKKLNTLRNFNFGTCNILHDSEYYIPFLYLGGPISDAVFSGKPEKWEKLANINLRGFRRILF